MHLKRQSDTSIICQVLCELPQCLYYVLLIWYAFLSHHPVSAQAKGFVKEKVRSHKPCTPPKVGIHTKLYSINN